MNAIATRTTLKEPHERLQAARIAAGFRSSKAAADKFGWSRSSLSQHECGARSFRLVAERYAKAFGVQADWLMYGDEPPPQRAAVPRPVDFSAVPHLAEATRAPASAAAWVPYLGDDPEPMPFAASFLERVGVQADACALVAIDEDTQTPDFAPGDDVLIDTNDTDTRKPGTFAVRAGADRVAMLDLQLMLGTDPPRVHVSVHGRNPYAYDVPADSLPVIGRVRWVGKAI